ncbi:MAG: hypothetical protein AAFU70_05015 [Planctomycetota bacterium]
MLSLPDVQEAGQTLSAVVTTSPGPVRVEDDNTNNVFYSPAGDTPIIFERDYDQFDAREVESFRLLEERTLAAEDPGLGTSRRFVNFNEAFGGSLNGGH